MSVKAQVLSALDAARGRYISGQELADQLGVSRAAIWKAVTALRADGTPIEAITNRGYALPHGADLLNGRHHSAAGPCRCAGGTDHCGGPPARHQCGAAHPGQQRCAGGPCADCPGPVRWARAVARAQLPRRAAVPEHFAAAAFSTRQSPQITALAAVAAARAAEQRGTPIQIKWVNDLWKNGKKVCGILTEAAVDLESAYADYAVLGLGFNLVLICPAAGPRELAR